MLYYFKVLNNQCISNPLVFGAKQMEKDYGYEFYGYGYLKVPQNYKIPQIAFNSTSFSIK